MLSEVCSFLDPQYTHLVDCTLGHGGHTMALLSIAQQAHMIAFDVDEHMMDTAKIRTQEAGVADRISFVHRNYADLLSVLWDQKVDFILNDLGVNLEHFKAVERGFSIRGNAFLDMRFDTSTGKTAADVLNTYSLEQLVRVFEQYADFSSPKAQEIARHLVSLRKKTPFATTQDFKLALHDCGLWDKASTVIFQSIRIEVNGELDNLKRFLIDFPKTLTLSWRCLVITYHSDEDRLVKQSFAELVKTWKYRLLTKKPIIPTYKEVAVNRAARSAKMRIVERIA